MSAHMCTKFDPNCWRCDLNLDEIAANEAEDREDAQAAWVQYRTVFMLGRPHRQHTMLRRRDFIAGFLAGRQ